MIPRGALDIRYSDLFAGFYYCCKNKYSTVKLNKNVLFCLSVRSGFDLVLQALRLPAGSEVLITDINIPGMFEIIKAHHLTAVPLPADKVTLAVCTETLRESITPATKAVVFTHLFGSLMEIDPLIDIARENGLFIIEDCAQAFNGRYRGNERSDIAMFSFGMIKTNTALGGALIHFRDNALCKTVEALQQRLPEQNKKVFVKKLITALAIKLVCSRYIYPLFYQLLLQLKKDPDEILTGFTRGFPGGDIFMKIRNRPCLAVQLLLMRKLRGFKTEQVDQRSRYGREILSGIPTHLRIGDASPRNTFWVLPVEAENPEQLINTLRLNGFDATAKASSMVKLPALPDRTPAAAALNLEKLIYLPVYPDMKVKDKLKLVALINAHAANS